MAVRKRKKVSKTGGVGVKKQGVHARINQCHDFAWSRSLWKAAARHMAKVCVAFIVVYMAAAVFLAQRDGLEGIDIYYFISTTMTTIGLGDISPQNQLNRACAIIILPYGLVVISFGISMSMAYARSLEKVPTLAAEAPDLPEQTDTPDKPDKPPLWAYVLAQVKGCYDALANNRLFVMFVKYCFVLTVGSAWFLLHPEERSLQQENGVEMTAVDAAYFATVLSTTVGYGHMMVAQHDDTKWFLTFYMIWSTIVVGSIIGDLSSLYLEKKSDVITATLIRSTTFVHQCDLFKVDRICEADYVLFKLQQMQMLDDQMLRRLTNRFSELDVEKRRLLIIGQHVPSAEQVKAMQKAIAGTSKTLIEAWKVMRLSLIQDEDVEAGRVSATYDRMTTDQSTEQATAAQKRAELSAGLLTEFVRGNATTRPKRVSDVHDFVWSRGLWKHAAYDTLAVASVLFVAYVVVGWNFLVDKHSRSRLWKAYFLSATLSTVGLGDIAPTTQDTRLAAVFLLPLGLVIIGFLLSYSSALDKSRKPRYRGAAADTPQELEMRALFEALDADGDGVLTLEECISGAKIMSMTEQQARNLYKDLDPTGSGIVKVPLRHPKPWRFTVAGKCWILFFKMYGLVAIGAVYFKVWENGAPEMTWVDACYMATVVATSIGFGDIVPQSDSGRLFMTIYMLVSTVIVGQALSDFIDVYVNDVVGERIIQTLIDSTTWVHSADIDKRGVITEADYVLFKLQQMMKVDAGVLDQLIDRFEELDDNGNGWLDIGIDVPSAAQVAEMNEELSVKLGKRSIIEAWEDKKKTLDEPTLRKAAMNANEWRAANRSGNPPVGAKPNSNSKVDGAKPALAVNSRHSSGGRNDSPRPMSSPARRSDKKKRIMKTASTRSFSDTGFFDEIRARDRSSSLDGVPEGPTGAKF